MIQYADPIQALLDSPDPCIRYLILTDLCGLLSESSEASNARQLIPDSERVRRLLSPFDESGRMPGVYSKFTGAHWVLADLADIGYPPGDPTLQPLAEQVCRFWLDPERTRERISDGDAARYKAKPGVPVINGRARRCASQEGNTLYAILALGLGDRWAEQIAEHLIRWQWPDGGWNCDRKASAHTSSFHESLLPLRGLTAYASESGDRKAAVAAEHCADYFLKRRLFRRLRDGSVIREEFLRFRYPHYWRYDILIALKVMAEIGCIDDPRCAEALDAVESKRLPDGGWRAEGKHYRVVDAPENGGSMTPWGTVSRKKALNPFVTYEALYVLKSAGRMEIE